MDNSLLSIPNFPPPEVALRLYAGEAETLVRSFTARNPSLLASDINNSLSSTWQGHTLTRILSLTIIGPLTPTSPYTAFVLYAIDEEEV